MRTGLTQPAVIVSLDALNQRLPTVTICPLTTQVHPAWRTRLGCRVGGWDAEIAVDQIRTISKARLGRKLGTLSSDEARAQAADYRDVRGVGLGHSRSLACAQDEDYSPPPPAFTAFTAFTALTATR